MKGRITYTTTLPSTPMMSPFSAADVFALQDVFAASVPAGSPQDIFLYWGYSALDPSYVDQRNVSMSAAGVVEIANFGSTTGFQFSVFNVLYDRTAQINEYQVMVQLNNELMNGTVITWYPDFENFPAEYYSCVANQRLAQKRIGIRMKFQFDFNLMVLAAVQVPSTVPAFVMA
jgi:hypothetical protein